MEVNLVKAMVRNGNTATLKPAIWQSIVNGGPGVSGRLAPKRADGECDPFQDKLPRSQ